METVRRCAYALASFEQHTQDYNKYLHKKVFLENSCNDICNLIKMRKNQEKTIAVNALYSENAHITACVYKGVLFVGFQDKQTGAISLNDYSNKFVDMPGAAPGKLATRIENAIRAEENGNQDFMSQQLAPQWEKLSPVLDKIIEQENAFKKLPVYAQESLTRQGQKEAQIDKIINAAMGDAETKQEKQVIADEKKEESDLCSIPVAKRFFEARKEAEEKQMSRAEKQMEKSRSSEMCM